jgi:RNA polymerase sigma-70 factor (ECF subfamily)
MQYLRMDTRAFIESLSPALRPAAQGLDLERLLSHILRRAEERWPAVGLPHERFFAHLATKVSGDIERALEALHVEDLYLAAGCSWGDAGSVRSFEQSFFSSHDSDELKAVLRERLLVRRPEAAPRIAGYSGVAPLSSWFKVASARASVNLKRDEARRSDAAVLMSVPLPGEGVELLHMKKLYRAEFAAAFEKALAALTVRDRNVLRLRYVDGLTHQQVAALHHVHPITVARWQAKAIDAVLSEVRATLMTRLSIGSSELDSILRMVRSGIEITLRGLLATKTDQTEPKGLG